LLPVDIVVVHYTNHQSVGERCGHGVGLFAVADDRSLAAPADFVEDLERDARILLFVSAERAPQRIEQIATRLVNRLVTEIFVF
jgi:hypothetical protein